MSIPCIFSDCAAGGVSSSFTIDAMKVHPVVHFFGRNAIRLVLILVFVGLPGAVLYLREVGIGFGAKEALAAALGNDSVRVSIGRLAFDPFAGLLAEDVVLTGSGDGRNLARLSDLSVSLNLSELSAGRVSVDRLELRGASVSIPLDSEAAVPRLEARDVGGELVLVGNQLRLSRLEGMVAGIRVALDGLFLNPGSFKPAPARSTGQTAHGKTALADVLENLSRLQFPAGAPVLRARVEADLADLSTLRLPEITLRCTAVTGEGLQWSAVELDASYQDGVARLPRLTVRDPLGSLEVSAEWSRATGRLDAALLSSIDPIPLLRLALGAKRVPDDVKLGVPPQLALRAEGDSSDLPRSVRVTGLLEACDATVKGVPFPRLGMNFAWKDGTFYARDVVIEAARGRLDGTVWVRSGDYRLEAKNSIPPTELLPLFDPKTREFLERMEFRDLPDVTVSLRAKALDFAGIRGKGHLKLGRTAMRGAWFDSADAAFEIGDRCVTYRDFVITRGDGRGTGSFAYDVGRQEARLEGVRSTLVPRDVLMWIDPKIAEAIAPYRFRAPPSVRVAGKVHLRDATKNDLGIDIDSAAGLDYDLLGKTLRFGRTQARVDVRGTRVLADVKRSTLLGGDVNLKADVSIDAKDPTFGADVTLNRVNFAELTDLYFKYNDSKGVMSGRYQFKARMGDETRMTGSGNIRVEDGNVFAIPWLGPFSEILGTILPGVVYETARLATADFTVADEKINTRNLVIEGAGFSMIGAGDIHFVTSRLDLSMRINARGIPGIVFYPVSKLFEYISTGTVADPQWRPKIIPRLGGGGNATTTAAPAQSPASPPPRYR